MRGGNFNGINSWIPRKAGCGKEGMQGASQLLIFSNADILLWDLSVTHRSQGAPVFLPGAGWFLALVPVWGLADHWSQEDCSVLALLLESEALMLRDPPYSCPSDLADGCTAEEKGIFSSETDVWSTDTSQPQAGSSTWKISFSCQASREHFLSPSIS